MPQSDHPDILRAIPPVDGLLSRPALVALCEGAPALPLTRLVRDAIGAFRNHENAGDIAGRGREAVAEFIEHAVVERAAVLRAGGLVPVLNGTGVILHTNLGRAVWSDGDVAASLDAMRGYVSLEVDRESGERAGRGAVLGDLVAVATGAEAATAVNNNAAAVYLAVNSYCPPGRVVVSRGELVEIGGSFRLPEILRHAATEVIEVGTTNRTYADDYRSVAQAGDILLKVHKSNYAIEGFSHEVSVTELAKVARETGAHVVYDVGSGSLFDFAAKGLGSDPPVGEVVPEVDAVTMSADKLLGTTQAGIIAGRTDFLARVAQNPLRRAVRVDKVTIAALQNALRDYLFGEPESVPVVAQVLGGADAMRERAIRIIESIGEPGPGVKLLCEADAAAVGGGSLASESLDGYAVVVRFDRSGAAVRFARKLRLATPAVFPRVRANDVRVNLRTILVRQDIELTAALRAALQNPKKR